jgi:hypothetical protein
MSNHTRDSRRCFDSTAVIFSKTKAVLQNDDLPNALPDGLITRRLALATCAVGSLPSRHTRMLAGSRRRPPPPAGTAALAAAKPKHAVRHAVVRDGIKRDRSVFFAEPIIKGIYNGYRQRKEISGQVPRQGPHRPQERQRVPKASRQALPLSCPPH